MSLKSRIDKLETYHAGTELSAMDERTFTTKVLELNRQRVYESRWIREQYGIVDPVADAIDEYYQSRRRGIDSPPEGVGLEPLKVTHSVGTGCRAAASPGTLERS